MRQIKIPSQVFHYTQKSSALDHILPKQQLRLRQFEFTNDPKESRSWVIPIQVLGMLPKNFSRHDEEMIHQEISRIKRREWKVFCVSKHHPRLKTQANLENAISINPFFLGSHRPNMWAHYATDPNVDLNANRQTGICLRFNGIKLDHRIREQLKVKEKCKVFCGSVKYNDFKFFAPPPLRIELSRFAENLSYEARNHIIKHYKDYFLLKSKDWNTEYEFRWVVFSEEDSAEYVSIDGLLEEVIVGADFPKEDEILISNMCRKIGALARRMEWKDGIPNSIPI
jgi:hypothetical protein